MASGPVSPGPGSPRRMCRRVLHRTRGGLEDAGAQRPPALQAFSFPSSGSSECAIYEPSPAALYLCKDALRFSTFKVRYTGNEKKAFFSCTRASRSLHSFACISLSISASVTWSHCLETLGPEPLLPRPGLHQPPGLCQVATVGGGRWAESERVDPTAQCNGCPPGKHTGCLTPKTLLGTLLMGPGHVVRPMPWTPGDWTSYCSSVSLGKRLSLFEV